VRRPLKWLALLAALALIAAACGGDDSGSGDTTTTAGGAEAFRIAIVAPSAANDLAFTQSIVDAVNVIKADMSNVEVAVTDNTFVVEDAATAIRGYASEGYDLVIAHGSQYGGSLEEIAPDFPDVSFAWGTAANTYGLANVYSYEAASDQGGYVLGVMAAALSESGTIGVVGPIEVGDAKLYVDGFVAGAKAENPSADVKVTYTGSFSDVALAKETAEAYSSQNVDVMSGTAQMVVGAVGVANTEGILWLGTQANQSSLGDIVVASQVYHWEVILDDIIANVQSGKLGGEIYEINLANEGEVIEYNPAYSLPDDVRQKAEDAIAGIADGSMSTGM
jgi:basic membrane protein A